MLMAQDPNSLIDSVKAIPEYVWILLGVLIAGVLPWIGIYLQLRHDSRERQKERNMSLRRDVYMSLAEKIGQLLFHLSNFYQVDIPSPDEYTEVMTQIDVIGNKETIRAANEFNDQLSIALYELIPEKHEKDSLMEELNDFVKKDVVDKAKSIAHVKMLGEEIIKRTRDLAKKCQQKSKLCHEAWISVIVAMRKELDASSFDKDAYLRMKEISETKCDENLETYLNSMRRINYEKPLQKIEGAVDDL
ncbi:MAG: hypothetical protein ACETWQ_06190 [Phycisphaerae bacterium]